MFRKVLELQRCGSKEKDIPLKTKDSRKEDEEERNDIGSK